MCVDGLESGVHGGCLHTHRRKSEILGSSRHRYAEQQNGNHGVRLGSLVPCRKLSFGKQAHMNVTSKITRSVQCVEGSRAGPRSCDSVPGISKSVDDFATPVTESMDMQAGCRDEEVIR